ncbi:MAG: helix-turn-helix transcriptional regulator [Cyanothece sp. SIO2G6]|nr:helix-turn-helix transcriptional regulator [Cyanothece sp. SIO2G6]
MARILTGFEVAEIMEEYRANGTLSEYREGSEHFLRSPLVIARGYGRSIQLRPGLTLSIMDYEKRHIHLYKIRQHPKPMPLTLSYYLSGGCRVENDGLKVSIEEMAGKSYLYCLPGTAETEMYPAGCRICRVHIQLASEFICGFSDRIHELPATIRRVIEHPEQALFCHSSQITPTQRNILQQILEWPYQGIARQLYLESKVLELIALQLSQLMVGQPRQPKTLKAPDIDRIYEARDILIRNMTNPPSIANLSQQVNLNENKLRQGFHQVFKTTVFGYLYEHRMEQARQILEIGNLNVQETAHHVGYTSRTAFVAAFKKKFRVSPSYYLKASS